jgi:threonine dehydrogenase-like Zn-dependent dehydrogenase
MVGQLFCRVLSARGDALLVLEPQPDRLLAALEHAERPAAPGDEVDYAVVTAPAGLDEALPLLRPGGTCLVFAAEPAPRPLDLDVVYRMELTLRGSRSSTATHLRAALDAIANDRVRVDDLVTDILPLDRFAEGLARYRAGAALKVVYRP